MTDIEQRSGTPSDDPTELAALANRAPGESVTSEALAAVTGSGPTTLWDIIDEDERPQYLLEGTMLDIVTGEEPVRKMAGRDGATFTLVTDRAVRFVVQYPNRLDVRTVPYDNIRAASLQTVGQNSRLSLETTGTDYVAYPSATTVEECNTAVAFVERQVQESPTGGDNNGKPESVLDSLERLAALRDRGALTDEEFDAKKTDLLDKL